MAKKRPVRCECGGETVFTVQRSGPYRWTYFRCLECRLEWTVKEEGVDLDEPVSSDEIVEVHKLLSRDVPFTELLNGKSST